MRELESPIVTPSDLGNTDEDLDGINSVPLLLYGEEADPELIERQDILASRLESIARLELRPYAKPSVIDYTVQSFLRRMHLREGLNSMAYVNRSEKAPLFQRVANYPREYVVESYEKSKYGTGLMTQKEIARHALGMNQAEFGNLTIMGEKRKHLEPVLWQQTSDLVGYDATPQFDQFYHFQVHGFDRDIRISPHVGAMRIELKRRIGLTEYGAEVKARTAATINLSPSAGINPDLVELFRNTALSVSDESDTPEEFEEQKLEEGMQKISELFEFKNAVKWLIEAELVPGLVLARNETVYGTVSKQENS